MTNPREAEALTRARRILASPPPARLTDPVEEPDDFDAMWPEDNEWASEAAARDMVFGRSA